MMINLGLCGFEAVSLLLFQSFQAFLLVLLTWPTFSTRRKWLHVSRNWLCPNSLLSKISLGFPAHFWGFSNGEKILLKCMRSRKKKKSRWCTSVRKEEKQRPLFGDRSVVIWGSRDIGGTRKVSGSCGESKRFHFTVLSGSKCQLLCGNFMSNRSWNRRWVWPSSSVR